MAVVLLAVMGAWIAAVARTTVPIAQAENLAYQANVLTRQGQLPQAVDMLDEASRIWPDNAVYPMRSARVLILGSGSSQEIRRRLAAAIAASPLSVAPYLTRANFELSRPGGDRSQALQDMRQALELNPCNVMARLSYAGILSNLGLNDQARREYRTAVQFNDALDKNNPKRLSNLHLPSSAE